MCFKKYYKIIPFGIDRHVNDQFIVHICPFPDLSNAPTDMKSEYSYWMLLCPGDWRSLRGCRQKTAVTIFHHHHHHHRLQHHHHYHHHHHCHHHHHHHHHAVLSRQREVPEEVSTEDCGHNVSSLKIGWVSSYLSSCTSASANMPQNRAGGSLALGEFISVRSSALSR